MKEICGATVVALLAFTRLAAPSTAEAKAGTPKKLFACSLGKKSVSVTAVGSRLTYQFGTPAKVEMAIIGSAGQGNVFYRSDRYAGMEYQIRFANGSYSYIVYSIEGNGRTGAAVSSGLVVMKGTKTIADMPCLRYTEFGASFDYNALPQDDEAHSAM